MSNPRVKLLSAGSSPLVVVKTMRRYCVKLTLRECLDIVHGRTESCELPVSDMSVWEVRDLRRDLIEVGATLNPVRCPHCLDTAETRATCHGSLGQHIATAHGRTPIPNDLPAYCGAMLGVSACHNYMGIPSPKLVHGNMRREELRTALEFINCEDCRTAIRKWFLERFAKTLGAIRIVLR